MKLILATSSSDHSYIQAPRIASGVILKHQPTPRLEIIPHSRASHTFHSPTTPSFKLPATKMTTPQNHPPPLPSEGGDTIIPQAEDIGRLQATFLAKSFSDHPSTWDSLWNQEYTPWDRGGPSLALNDLITEHPEYFPHLAESQTRQPKQRPKALVPGCGRGHDVILLSRLGYDAYGLDFSERAIQEAKEREKEEQKESDSKVDRGKVTWVAGDFFDEEFLLKKTGAVTFDLIFDYTFFCALPIGGRPKWAKRITSLLNPLTGRLVCLEWPLHKPPKTGGPPWGVTAQVYAAHVARPGESLPYDEDGNLITDRISGRGDGLERIARVRPTRTHKAGYDPDGNMIDFISVWGWGDSSNRRL